MKILLHSATALELDPILNRFEKRGEGHYRFLDHELQLCISGVGMMATAFSLGDLLAKQKFDLALSTGICGAFDKSIEVGEVVFIEKDRAIEEGAEDGDQWISLEEMGLRDADQSPFENATLPCRFSKEKLDRMPYKWLSGISVNRVLGKVESIERVKQLYPAEVVNMEGAAFYYACGMHQLDCLQIKAVSNYVENRNKDAWEIDRALRNLAVAIPKILEHV